MKDHQTIYVRPSHQHPDYKWEAFAKTKGEGVIVGGVTKDDAIQAAGQCLWAIEKFGPADYKNHGPIDALPDMPTEFDYPIVDEQ